MDNLTQNPCTTCRVQVRQDETPCPRGDCPFPTKRLSIHPYPRFGSATAGDELFEPRTPAGD